MNARCALVLVNRHSRSGGTQLDAGLGRMVARGFEVKRCELGAVPDLDEQLGRLLPQRDRVIVAGGDGTVSMVAAKVMAIRVPLGIIPLGTANDLARTLGIPPDVADAFEVAAGDRRTSIDVGDVNGRVFLNVAHIGLGVDVTRQLSKEVKRRWGILGYARALWRAFEANRSFRAEILCDEIRRHVRCIHVSVGNGPHYGGGMKVHEDAAIDDHRLDCYYVRPMSIARLARFAHLIRAGKHRDTPIAEHLRGEQVLIRTRRAMSISADGEIVGRTPARFSIVPDALEVFVPELYPHAGSRAGKRGGGAEPDSGCLS